MTRWFLVSSILAACHGSPPHASSTRVAPSQLPLVTVNGTMVAMTSAVAYEDLGNVHVRVSSAKLDCPSVLTTGVSDVAGRTELEVSLQPRLFPDGTFGWAIYSDEFGSAEHGFTGPALASDAQVDPAPGHHSMLPVGDTKRKITSGEETRTLVTWGIVDAIGCGVRRPPASPERRNRDGAIEIGGKVFPITQAKFARTRLGLDLVLATGEVWCSDDGPFALASSIAPLVVTLRFEDEGLRPARARLRGRWLHDVLDDTRHAHDDSRAPAISERPRAGAKELDIALSGASSSASKDKLTYAYSLTGHVVAQVCPDQLSP
jgi:hypothetical protein